MGDSCSGFSYKSDGCRPSPRVWDLQREIDRLAVRNWRLEKEFREIHQYFEKKHGEGCVCDICILLPDPDFPNEKEPSCRWCDNPGAIRFPTEADEYLCEDCIRKEYAKVMMEAAGVLASPDKE